MGEKAVRTDKRVPHNDNLETQRRVRHAGSHAHSLSISLSLLLLLLLLLLLPFVFQSMV